MKNLKHRFNMSILLLCVIFYFFPQHALVSQNVFLVVIDGARYSETFGSKEKYIPKIWNRLRPLGTIYTNFYNDGITATIPGHLAMETGIWQKIANDGSEQCSSPTLFEYYRKQNGVSTTSCFVVSGKKKLHVLTHSTDSSYGSKYQATFIAPDEMLDVKVWMKLVEVIDQHHPRFVLINFPEVDKEGHDGNWSGYLHAIRQVDSLVFLLWQKIQGDSVYKNATTMFITNDHGRHDEKHGGFQHHGDSCEGCRHIMLLAIGPVFLPNIVVTEKGSQIDVTPTISEIFGLTIPMLKVKSLLQLNKSSQR